MIKRLSGLIFFIFTITYSVYAQNNDTNIESDTILLNDVIIEENRFSYSFSEASRNVGIIEKTEIENSPVQSFQEMLTYQPAVDIRQRGPVGVQADIGIRGGTFEQTLILLNGVKLTDPQTGHHLLNVPIGLDNIERIEVLKGPAARIFGQNAYAGSVNFITKVPDENSIHFRGYGGSFGSWGGNLSASLRNEKSGHYISLSNDQSDGYRYNTDYKILNGFYQNTFEINNRSKIDFIAGITQRKFGANGFYASPDFVDQYEEVRTGMASLSYTYQNENFKIVPRISWRNNRDKYDFVRDNPEVYENLHFTNTYSAEVNSSLKSKFGITGVGIEFRYEEIKGDWLRGGTASKSNLDGFSRDNFGTYLEHKIISADRKFDITPGVYFGWYSDFGGQFFPGVDAGYNITNFLRIYGNVGKSYRIPTFYDQYYESPVEVGNPDLKPEKAWNYEIGLRYIQNGFTIEGNVFYRDNQNLIDWVFDPTDTIWMSENFTSVSTVGLELFASYDLPISLVDNHFFISRLSASLNKIDQNKDFTDEQSRYALEHLADQVIVSAEINIYDNLKMSWSFRHIIRYQQDAYNLLDGRIFWQSEKYNLFAEVTNLTDTQYTEVMTPMPGRWFRGGLTLNFVY